MNPITIEIPDDTQVVYVKIAGHTVYIDVSMLETSGEFIVAHSLENRLELSTIQFTCCFDPSHHLEKPMTRSNMLIVAEGILDSAAVEYRETNLASCESVADYASNGCGIELTEDECERVLCACRKYIAAESSSSNDYYAIVEEALNT